MQEKCDKCERPVDVFSDGWNLCRFCAPKPSPDILRAIHALKSAGLLRL